MTAQNNFAAIFDMDGVLVDNAVYHERAFAEYFASFGVVLKPEMYGRGNDELMAELFPDADDELRRRYADGKEAYYRQIYAPHIRPVAGLTGLLAELRRNGVPTAVGSSAPMANIDFVLDTLDLRRYFDTVVVAAMVAKAKPAPDIYLRAAELLHTPPARCVVFEDALAGLAAARAAGAKVVGVATSLPKAQLLSADRVISDFTEISLDEIRRI
jgi:HAD superfamily hydrolase (TIGR01509 family)